MGAHKAPIGLKFGAKTPAELAIAIVAELIDVRYIQRYDAEARERHERGLGRRIIRIAQRHCATMMRFCIRHLRNEYRAGMLMS